MLTITQARPPALLRDAEPKKLPDGVKSGLQFLAALGAISGVVWGAVAIGSLRDKRKKALAGAGRRR